MIHCVRIRKQIAEDLTNLYSVLEFGGGDTLVHLDVRRTSLLWWPTCSQLQTAAHVSDACLCPSRSAAPLQRKGPRRPTTRKVFWTKVSRNPFNSG